MRFLFVYSDLTRKQPKYEDLFIEGQRERERGERNTNYEQSESRFQ